MRSPGPFLERQYLHSAERLSITLYITEGASSDNKSFLNAGYRTAGIWEEWDHGDHAVIGGWLYRLAKARRVSG